MPAIKLKELQYETDSWKSRLTFMKEENILFKNKISEILSNGFDRNLLEDVEEFQNRFIKADEVIGLLRNDIAEIDKLLIREIFEDGKILKEIELKFKRFRNHLIVAQRQFDTLKKEFNSFLKKDT
jgi:glutaredoxin 2